LTSVYYDGDSFSCMLPPGETQTTGHIISKHYGLELDHYGFVGKNSDKIIRSSMRYSFDNKKSLMLIGIGAILRTEIYTDDVLPFDYPYKFFHQEHSIQTLYGPDAEKYADLLHWQYKENCILMNLIALHDYLSYNNVNFIIHNLGNDYFLDEEYAFAYGIHSEIRSRKRIVNFYENSLHSLMKEKNMKPWDYDRYGWEGHPDEQGHAMYADFLMEHIDV